MTQPHSVPSFWGEPKEGLVEENGEILNHAAMDELLRWGMMTENIRGFSGRCSSIQK